MAERTKKPKTAPRKSKRSVPEEDIPTWGELARMTARLLARGLVYATGAFLAFVVIYAFVNPRLTPYIIAERFRLGGIERTWVAMEDMPPVVARAFVAAEDANFCQHWGFDVKAIRKAIEEGEGRGASTISQQVTKNVFLWQGRSWPRKALEGLMTPVVELVWTKRRILEVYLNVAETGPGLFGVDAAARHYFGVGAAELTPQQAARIASVLPDPKGRNPAKNSGYIKRRAAQIVQGAETIEADGRAACFEG
jgi:monofunctional glycosyltransferase